ncbi:MAG: DUF4249 family protein [Bacteroidota bacterium]
MKKLILLFPAICFLFASCSNDFEVTASWKEVPVVYAILSAKDTANYIRVEKAFLDPDRSALEVAQVADSIYYPANALQVYLEHVKTSIRVQLTRVDGNLEGLKREGGIFATTPNWLYKIKTPTGSGLIPGDKYKLVIVRNDGKKDITAVTTVPGDFKFVTPSNQDIPPKISFLTGKNSNISWSADTNSVYFDVDIVVHYRVENAAGSTLMHRTFTWKAAKNIPRKTNAANTNYDVSADFFFQILSDTIRNDDLLGRDTISSDRFRYFDGIDIVLSGGGSEIKTYLETASANAGLTGSEVIASYTNLSEGYGIFTAKNTGRITDVKVTEITINNMNANPVTKALNFKYF